MDAIDRLIGKAPIPKTAETRQAETLEAWQSSKDAARLMRDIRRAASETVSDRELREEISAVLASRVFGVDENGATCEPIGADAESLAEWAPKIRRRLRDQEKAEQSLDAITADHGADAIDALAASIPNRPDHRGDAYLAPRRDENDRPIYVDPRPDWVAEFDRRHGAKARGITRTILTPLPENRGKGRDASRVSDSDLARVWNVSRSTVSRARIQLALVETARRAYRVSPDAKADSARRKVGALRQTIEAPSYLAPLPESRLRRHGAVSRVYGATAPGAARTYGAAWIASRYPCEQSRALYREMIGAAKAQTAMDIRRGIDYPSYPDWPTVSRRLAPATARVTTGANVVAWIDAAGAAIDRASSVKAPQGAARLQRTRRATAPDKARADWRLSDGKTHSVKVRRAS